MKPVFLAIGSLLFAACVGAIEPSPSAPAPTPRRDQPMAEPPPSSAEVTCGAPVRPRARIRRLTRTEYAATVRGLLGHVPPLELLPDDGLGKGFDTNPDNAVISAVEAEKYQLAAHNVADQAATGASSLFTCAGSESACFEALLDGFVSRAFRRPVTADERTRYRAFLTKTRADRDYAGTVHLFVSVVLQSPNFLYRTELGAAGGATVTLEGHELASALSYLLLGTPPDAELNAAAAAGRLKDSAQIEAHARRLMASPAGFAAPRRFFEHWLELRRLETVSKDPKTYPMFSSKLAHEMAEETLGFIQKIVWEGDRQIGSLFTADKTIAGGALAEIYGRQNASGVLALDPAQRSGVLTHASFLSINGGYTGSSPLYRGKFVAEKLFCTELPPPPEQANQMNFTGPDATPREEAEARLREPLCKGCHSLMDKTGFAFEAYDGIGRFRTEERGKPVDGRGELLVSGDVDGPLTGPRSLAERLMKSGRFRACFSAQMVEFALGLDRKHSDLCPGTDPRVNAALASGDLRELMVAVVTSPAFRERTKE